jgi:D-alanyl-D-alanine carboxypeptidase/D-alanyl-D-alanine-endopeptidase (penicillin-binding protein 4)
MARRRNPYPTLIGAALLPALLLGGCWRFAASKAPAGVDTSATGATPNPVGAALNTPLLSVRRSPAVLARDVNITDFRSKAQAFMATLDPQQCAAISIDGQAVAATHEQTVLRPASNVKLFTASVALDVLGPAYTFTTDVRGTLKNGMVDGDLYLVGGGDPVLSSSWWKGPNTKYPPFNVTSIEAFAQKIKSAGVTRVTGGIVGDASRYDAEWYPPSWTKDLRFTEGGPISALLVNDARETPTTSSNDPAVGAAKVLTKALTDIGVTVAGKASAGTAPSAASVIADISSQPLPAILEEMLTTSDNNTAEMLLKEIGHQASGKGSREAGLGIVKQRLAAWGIPTTGLELYDGSGLSDDNRVTCTTVLALLQHLRFDDPVGKGLAIAGKAGGTLSDAFVGTTLQGRLRAKTGTLYNYSDGVGGKPGAKSLSGFLPVDGGGAIEFSMLLNGPSIAEKNVYRPIWDALGKVLASYPSGPTVAELAPK